MESTKRRYVIPVKIFVPVAIMLRELDIDNDDILPPCERCFKKLPREKLFICTHDGVEIGPVYCKNCLPSHAIIAP